MRPEFGECYKLDRQSLAGFDEKDIPFLEKLVETCIEDSVTDPTCIRKGLKGRWKFSWRNKKWAVGIHDSSFSEGLKEIGFNQCAMRAHFKDLGPKKMDIFMTADFPQYMLDRQSLAGFGEKNIPFLEKLVEKCIEDRVADTACIHKGLNRRSKWSWQDKIWSVGSHESSASGALKEIEFDQYAMRAHFKDSGPEKMDVFITAD